MLPQKGKNIINYLFRRYSILTFLKEEDMSNFASIIVSHKFYQASGATCKQLVFEWKLREKLFCLFMKLSSNIDLLLIYYKIKSYMENIFSMLNVQFFLAQILYRI